MQPDGDVVSFTYNAKTHSIAFYMTDMTVYILDLNQEELLSGLDRCLTQVAEGSPEPPAQPPSIAGMTFHENGRLASLTLAEPCLVMPDVLGHIMAGHPATADDLLPAYR